MFRTEKLIKQETYFVAVCLWIPRGLHVVRVFDLLVPEGGKCKSVNARSTPMI
jgi:hypothetical protein